MGFATLLRTLTEKSKLGFGRYADVPVWKLLERLSTRSYLVWVYYNNDRVTFKDEILDQLRITDRIEKPGKSPDKFEEYQMTVKWSMKAKYGWNYITKGRKSRNIFLTRKRKISTITKGKMQAKNHSRKIK